MQAFNENSANGKAHARSYFQRNQSFGWHHLRATIYANRSRGQYQKPVFDDKTIIARAVIHTCEMWRLMP